MSIPSKCGAWMQAFVLAAWAGVVAAATPAVSLQETAASIQIRGESGASARYVRSFRLRFANPPASAPTFESSDLQRVDGAPIDRSKLTVHAVDGGANRVRNYQLAIEAQADSGLYIGTIDVLLSDEPVLKIPVELTVAPRKVVGLLSEAPSLQVDVASNCRSLTRWLLGAAACAQAHAIPLRIDRQTSSHAKPPLIALSEPSRAIGQDALSANLLDDKLMLTVRAENLGPGTYKGIVRVGFDWPTEAMQVPITVNVRSSALWSMLVILFGVLVGQLVRYMNEKGNALAEARAKSDSLLRRASRLRGENMTIVERFGNRATDAINDRNLELATGSLADLEKAVQIFESLELLHGKDPPEAETSQIQDLVRIGELVEADTQLQALRKRMQSAVSRTLPPNEVAGGLGHRFTFATDFITSKARRLLYWILVAGLVLTALETLYVPAATLGARAIADYFGLFAWGLTTDVASRTLANFRGR